jgi:hypothetical protein
MREEYEQAIHAVNAWLDEFERMPECCRLSYYEEAESLRSSLLTIIDRLNQVLA